ncbi:MRPL35 [Candida pseudojiufengensis]|uniref:MRPL35 n=1 Tax=Candida pseudojiufengensis TaxID=497109 RepID=UPI0022248190|nr:MRPL35 [Candida pseudojiufengensis]KAI5964760.1 MRPL35 [Candida pseudojiufengensis]
MIRSSLRVFKRSQSSSTFGIWSNFTNRSPRLQLQDESIKKDLFNELPKDQKPASILTYDEKQQYHSPIDIDETFSMAYKILEKEAESKYKYINRIKLAIDSKQVSNEELTELKDQLDKILIDAEIENPEVLYNFEFLNSEDLDKSQPVYRALLKQKWENYDLLVTMQRLEQLHVIPDTLPTLNPKADVKVKFTHNIDTEFQNWITPGTLLPAFAVSKPPTIHIQEFERKDGNENLYTVLLVNPDTPDLETNSFKTTLHYGLKNVSLTNNDNTIDVSRIMKNGPKITFHEYLPLTPEKNAGVQRACLWVFRQDSNIDKINEIKNDENFNIRKFVDEYKITPIGAHVWRQKFDRSVPNVRNEYGLGKGRVFEKIRGTEPLNL